MGAPPHADIDAYLADCTPEAREVLATLRLMVHRLVPDVTECISYGMPTYRLGKVLLHTGAFKAHVGLFPPVPPEFAAEAAPWANEKGNLRLPLGEPIPWALLERILSERARAPVRRRG